MWQCLWLWSLLQAPYEFEIDRGPTLELRGGASLADTDDDESWLTGVRLSYSFLDITDSYWTAEIDFNAQRATSEVSFKDEAKYQLDGNLVFYETFNPAAFRAAVGLGVERRGFRQATGDRVIRYRPSGNYRIGLGWFFSPNFALFGDFSQKAVMNRRKSKIFDGAQFSQSLEVTLSVQTVF
jgi:hypothetical protein